MDNKVLIGSFMAVVVAVIVFSVVAGTLTPMTTPKAVNNESKEGLGQSYLLTYTPVDAVVSIRNKTKESQVFTSPDDYNITLSTGNVTMIRKGNFTNYYTYQESGYITGGTTRTVFSYIALILAISIIVYTAYMIKT